MEEGRDMEVYSMANKGFLLPPYHSGFTLENTRKFTNEIGNEF